MIGVVLGRRDAVDEQIEQWPQVRSLGVLLGRGVSGLGVGVDDREVDLRLVRIEIEEQLVDLIQDLPDACVGAVHLVDYEDHG